VRLNVKMNELAVCRRSKAQSINAQVSRPLEHGTLCRELPKLHDFCFQTLIVILLGTVRNSVLPASINALSKLGERSGCP
jgi:hypothetical protein